MSRRFDELAARHASLLARSAGQRRDAARLARDIEARLGPVDRGVRIVRSLARSPVLIAAGVAAIALLGPKRLLRWASRGVLFFSTARRMVRLVR